MKLEEFGGSISIGKDGTIKPCIMYKGLINLYGIDFTHPDPGWFCPY